MHAAHEPMSHCLQQPLRFLVLSLDYFELLFMTYRRAHIPGEHPALTCSIIWNFFPISLFRSNEHVFSLTYARECLCIVRSHGMWHVDMSHMYAYYYFDMFLCCVRFSFQITNIVRIFWNVSLMRWYTRFR